MAISIDKYVDINSASSGAGSGDSVPAGSSDIQLFRDPASGRYFTPSEYVGTVEKRADGKYYADGAEANVVTYQTSVTGVIRNSISGKLYAVQGQPDLTPKIMSSPPTITVTNNTNGAGSVSTPKTLPGQSYTSIICDDTKAYLPLGVGNIVATRGSGTLGAYTATWPSSGIGVPQIVRPAFMFPGQIFSFTARQFSGVQFRIMIDGEYATRYPVSLGGSANNYGEVKVDLGSRGTREIIIELCGTGDLFLGITHQINDTVRAITPPSRRLVVASDSYGGGSKSSPIGSFPTYLAHGLGFVDFVNSSAGSTGWLANGSYANLATNLDTAVIAQAPTDLVIAMGHNDTSFSNAEITAQVVSVLNRIKAALPNLLTLHVIGPLFPGSSAGVYAAMSAAIKAGCDACGVVYIDTVAIPIFPADVVPLMIDTADNVHPTDAGSEWLGYQIAQRIRAASVNF